MPPAVDEGLERRVAILVLDSQPLFAAALAELLEGPPLRARVVLANTAREAFTVLERQPIDVAVCDAAAHSGGWPELLHAIHQRRRGIPVVLLADPEDDAILSAVLAGAAGVFSKASAPEELIEGIRGVVAGEVVIESALLAKAIFSLPERGGGATELAERLSISEAHVLELLAAGASIGEIAVRTHLSQRTVRNHLATGYRKLRLHRARTHPATGERLPTSGRRLRVLVRGGGRAG